MEDQFAKYLRLFGTLFLTLFGFIVAVIVVLLSLRFMFGLLSYIPWFTYVYMILILFVPAALFISVFISYFIRTRYHPSAAIRAVSYFVFSAALLTWATCFIWDMISFFKHVYTDIGKYYTYNLLLLSASVGLIFFVGIIQAFSRPEEKDWMAKHRE